MKISLRWLKNYVGLPASLDELEDTLSCAGLSVENVNKIGADFPQVVVAQILDSQPHPNADRLSICQVEDGSGTPRQIVCGAKNYRVGDKVPLALPGAELPGGLRIKVGRLRGVESQGMMCSARELELAEDAEGLLILATHWKPGTPLGQVFPPDTVVELEVTPNRPDCLGHLGVAREIAAFTGASLHIPEPAPLVFTEAGNATVHEPEKCPLYTLTRVCGIQAGTSPSEMARDLEAVGLRPLNLPVDVTNWVMMETGQPLHVFDAAKVSGQVCVRCAQPGETLDGLDGRHYRLEGGELVIADERGVLALAGIVGGVASAVDATTRDVLLESAVFDAAEIRRTARKLGAATESSFRFERGVDPEGTLFAARRAIALLEGLAGGTGAGTVCLRRILPSPRPVIPFRPSRCRALLGAEISDDEIRGALESLGLREEGHGWRPPSYRLDLVREADLVEEVARRIGMDRIPSRLTATPAAASRADRLHDLVVGWKNRLASLGLSEARSGSLVSPKEAEAFPRAIPLRNPLGHDQSFLRPSLLPGLLEALRRNLNAGAESIALFEVGKIFQKGASEECLMLGILLHGKSAPESWRPSIPREFDFFDLKGILETLLPQVSFVKVADDERQVLKMAVKLGDEVLGHIGQLSPTRARELDARGPVLLGELELDLKLDSPLPSFTPLPSYPSSRRDIAIVVPETLSYHDIAREILEAQEPLLRSFEPFDVFMDETGNRVPKGAKSLALALTFSSPERTLNSDEITQALQRLKQRLATNLGVSFRD